MTKRRSSRSEAVAPTPKDPPINPRESNAATVAESAPVQLSPAEEERVVRAERIAAAVDAALRQPDAALIDRLFFTLERGRQRKLEASALMRAFEETNSVDGVIALLRGWGYAQFASRLAGKRGTVTRACEAWRNDETGARSGNRGTGKWMALQRLTGFTAESLRTLWKRELRPTPPED